MADSYTTNLNLRLPEVGFAADTWGNNPGLNGDLLTLDGLFKPNGTGKAVGFHVGTMTMPDSSTQPGILLVDGTGSIQIEGTGVFTAPAVGWLLFDEADTTKQFALDLSALPTATTIVAKSPPANGTLATQEYVQQVVTARLPTGTVLEGYYGNVAPAGFVMASGKTIGNLLSGGTERANADTVTLFTQLWNTTTNTECPVLPGGRGTTAALDYAANKTITLPDHSGKTMYGRDDLSGTNRNILSGGFTGSTTRGKAGGVSTETAAVTVAGSATGSISLPLSGYTDNDAAFINYVQGGGPVQAISTHNHDTLYGNASGSVGLTANATGNTAAVTNAAPGIVIDVIIAL